MGLDLHEIAEELEELEKRIDRLRALYEQYFMGIEKLEPQIPRKDVERRIHALRKEKLRNTGQRFKFQMLAQRYNTMQQHWGRIVREIENGTYRRGLARGAQRSGEAEPVTILAKRRQQRLARLAATQAEHEPALHPAVAEPAGAPAASEAERVLHPAAVEPAAAPAAAERVAQNPAVPPPVAPGLGLFFRGSPGVQKRAPAALHPPPASASSTSSHEGPSRAAALAAGLKTQRSSSQPRLSEPIGLDFDSDAATPAFTRVAAPPREVVRSAPSPARPPPPRGLPHRAPPSPPVTSPAPHPPLARPTAPAAPHPPLARPTAPAAPHPAAAAARPAAPPPTPSSPQAARSLSEQRVRQIYNQYVEARRSANESTAGLTYDKLARTLNAQSEKYRASHATKTVDFEVEVKNGRTVLKPVLK
jgi:hypothetical protein